MKDYRYYKTKAKNNLYYTLILYKDFIWWKDMSSYDTTMDKILNTKRYERRYNRYCKCVGLIENYILKNFKPK